jgi:hypothetical protein
VKRVYGLLPWFLIALGAVHCAATWRFYHQLTPAALWFFNGGIVLIFTGVLNLINHASGAEVKTIRWFCRAANVVMLGFTVISGVVGKAGIGSMIALVGIMGAITVLSFMPIASERAQGRQ